MGVCGNLIKAVLFAEFYPRGGSVVSHAFFRRGSVRRMLHGLVAVAVVAGLSLPAVAMFAQPAGATSTPTIASDQADYPPGATVTLAGTNWQGDTSVTIFVNDSIGNTWSSKIGRAHV